MEQPNLNNIITISGQITIGTIKYSEITISGRKKPSINYRLILNDKQIVEFTCSHYLSINQLDKIEVTGELLGNNTLLARSVKMIKKYLPPQRRIWDFEK